MGEWRTMTAFGRFIDALPEAAARVRGQLGEADWLALQRRWGMAARDAQSPPPGDWRVWLMMAGRGFGKTRAGAEWVDG